MYTREQKDMVCCSIVAVRERGMRTSGAQCVQRERTSVMIEKDHADVACANAIAVVCESSRSVICERKVQEKRVPRSG